MAARIVLALLLSLLVPRDVRALTIDPDDFASGTDISNAFPGVSLSVTGDEYGIGFGASGAVFSVDPQDPIYTGDANFSASTGTQVFGHDGELAISPRAPIGHVWRDNASV